MGSFRAFRAFRAFGESGSSRGVADLYNALNQMATLQGIATEDYYLGKSYEKS